MMKDNVQNIYSMQSIEGNRYYPIKYLYSTISLFVKHIRKFDCGWRLSIGTNNVDSDWTASYEAVWSGFTLFALNAFKMQK